MPIFKSVNHDFFKTWSHNMAYVLGFFAADGTMTHSRRNTHYVTIEINDKDLIEKIKACMESNHTIGMRKRTDNHNVSYRLQIGSKIMYNDLVLLGFTTNKTKNMSVPNVPSAYFNDFVRGYFDGDGNIWMGYIHKKRATQTLILRTAFTSCSYRFLFSLQGRLTSEGARGVLKKSCKGNYYRLYYSVRSSLRLHTLMYTSGNSGLHLERKKRIFEEYMKKMRL